MTILFVSDLHLDPEHPAVTRLFLNFLAQRVANAIALYILGDLFDAWIGDDDDGRLGRDVAAALKVLGQQGVPVYFIHGNRDFLVGEDFAAASGIVLRPEADVIDLQGIPALIMHGDTLCTDDLPYQAFRTQVRSPQWQAQMLNQPLDRRRLIAKQLRNDSREAVSLKAADITDVNQDTVKQVMQEHGVKRLIHGHTHRPAVHEFTIHGKPAKRIVLGDWHHQGSVLCCDATGWRLEQIPIDE